METLNYNILEALNKEWTTFLDTFLWNSPLSIADSNKLFAARRKNWMNRMQRKYDVTLQQLKDYYVHD